MKATDNSDNTIAEYRYDGLHRRIRKFLPDGDDWTVKEYYYNLGWQVLEVRKEDGKARTGTPLPEPSLAAHWYERYTWSPRYIDALIARQRDADGDAQHTLEESLFYTHDANMNVTAVVNMSREVVERYMYDAYGKVTVLDGSTGGQTDWDTDADGKSDVDNEILYGGYRFDPETGLYHVRHRMYHPTLGRWLHRDPIGYVHAMNLYEYVSAQPVNHLDPAGLMDYDGIEAIIMSEYDRPRRQMARNVVQSLTPSGYRYVDRFGVRQFAKNLNHGIDHVKSFGTLSLFAQHRGLGAVWHDILDHQELRLSDPPSLVAHELAHAFDDLMGYYLRWPRNDLESAEALGYTTQHLFRLLEWFRDIEDEIRARWPCDMIKTTWNAAWNDALRIIDDDPGRRPLGPLRSIHWFTWPWEATAPGATRSPWRFMAVRHIRAPDVEDVARKLGLSVSCNRIESIYNEMMYEQGILDDREPGKCCTVDCPKDLRGTPFE